MAEKILERNHLGRIKFEYSPELIIWVEDNEYEFLDHMMHSKNGYLWVHDMKSIYFDTVEKQNSFIKRMLKYGVFAIAGMTKKETSIPDNSYIHYVDLSKPIELHMQSGHNVEQWIRDHWDNYSNETMEVGLVKGEFDIKDHIKILIAHTTQ